MSIITIGIDLAKNVFAVHGVNESGRPVLIKSKVSRVVIVGRPIADLRPARKPVVSCYTKVANLTSCESGEGVASHGIDQNIDGQTPCIAK